MRDPEWPTGYDRTVLEEVDSTNRVAREHAARGERGPLWIAARRQTEGRGRGGRSWSTETGNLAATLLAPMPAGGPARAATLSFVAGLAAADALRSAADLEVRLKWPNDLLANRRKIAGVLLECLTNERAVVVGIGVNLAHAPRVGPGRWPATSALAETGRTPDFDLALEALARAWSMWFARWQSGFEPVRDAWTRRAALLGERIEARLPNETLRGVFEGVDHDGALLLGTAGGARRIGAADVFAA